MSRNLRYLRVVFSMFCGLLCVLLVILWVRSYWRIDGVHAAFMTRTFDLSSINGLAVFATQLPRKPGGIEQFMSNSANPAPAWGAVSVEKPPGLTNRTLGLPEFPEFDFYSLADGTIRVVAPLWFGAMLSAGLAAATLPWFSWRFSLRTLLIAITLIGLILGTIIATTR